MRHCAASGDVAAWEEFVRRFHRLIATVVLRTASRLGDSSSQTVDDLIQETYLKLCEHNYRILRNFSEHHADAFLGYLPVVTVNVVRDHFKLARARKRGPNQIWQLEGSFVTAEREDLSSGPSAIERDVLIEEIRGHLDRCIEGSDQDRDKQVFWHYYRAGLSASAIAALPGIGLTTKGVESLILRITRMLRDRLSTSASAAQIRERHESEGIPLRKSLLERRSELGHTPE